MKERAAERKAAQLTRKTGRKRPSEGQKEPMAREQEEKWRRQRFGGAVGISMVGVGWLMYLLLTAPPGGPEPVTLAPMLLPVIGGGSLHDEPGLLQSWAYLMAAAAGLGCLMLLWDVASYCIAMSLVGFVVAYQKATGVR